METATFLRADGAATTAKKLLLLLLLHLSSIETQRDAGLLQETPMQREGQFCLGDASEGQPRDTLRRLLLLLAAAKGLLQ